MSLFLRWVCGCWMVAMTAMACSAGVESGPGEPTTSGPTTGESTSGESPESTQNALSSSCVSACMASCVCTPEDGKPTICRRRCQHECEETCSVCIPSCAGKACGASDGCEGVCSSGSCPSGTTCGGGGIPNQCGCTPSCEGKACGASDGCGGVCSSGGCPSGTTCGGGGIPNQCGCTPSCEGKACGDANGCGGLCANACPAPVPGLIDFDVTPAGVPLADATVVDTTYQSWGVTMSSIDCRNSSCITAPAFARRGFGRDGSNSVSLSRTAASMFDATLGAVEARFNPPRSTVSIDTIAIISVEDSTAVARPFIEAYDAAGNVIAGTYYPNGVPRFGSWQTLTVSAPGIQKVRFSSQAPGNSPHVFANFDNLRFQ